MSDLQYLNKKDNWIFVTFSQKYFVYECKRKHSFQNGSMETISTSLYILSDMKVL